MLGVIIGFFDTAESIPSVYFGHISIVFSLLTGPHPFKSHMNNMRIIQKSKNVYVTLTNMGVSGCLIFKDSLPNRLPQLILNVGQFYT